MRKKHTRVMRLLFTAMDRYILSVWPTYETIIVCQLSCSYLKQLHGTRFQNLLINFFCESYPKIINKEQFNVTLQSLGDRPRLMRDAQFVRWHNTLSHAVHLLVKVGRYSQKNTLEKKRTRPKRQSNSKTPKVMRHWSTRRGTLFRTTRSLALISRTV